MARIALRRGMLPQVGVRSGGLGRREPRETGENEPARPSELETAGGELAPRERREPARRREKLLIFSTEGQVPDAGASEMNSNGDAGGGDGRNRWWWMVLAVVVVRSVWVGWCGCSQDGMRKRAQRRRRDRIPVVRPVRKRGSQAEPLVFGVGLAGGADCAAEPGRCHSAPNFRSEGTVHEPLLSSSLAALPGADTSIITEFRGLHRICPPPIPDMTGLNYGHTIATRTY
ncbi:hypothetical protein BDBG_09030 [Blastomyces gilchristii SLH14081]|uniref:Uncharacterized protein n=1 Tax=Blastomyces gilchristii (strain SLH14081) TaxID=559298 RepID=A0A179V5K1_BLAGS|nr:uncharacterized protein BDBG_09030 [Blastomyces gilchristii SLH14081]OAT13922.1 hypothetical protein BDBG_09030 [Blastomyces gilchristii SLH14081]